METTLDSGERQVAPEGTSAAASAERDLRAGFEAFQHAAARLTDSYDSLRRRVAEMDVELAETNRRLRETLEERETVLALLPVGVVATDSAGDVRWENSEARRILGEGGGRELLAGAGGALCVRAESAAVRTKVAPLPGGGRLVVLEDRSRIESLERRVLRLDRLAALSELAFGIAHELRNPLNAVTGFAGLLRRAKSLSQVEEWGAKVEEGVRQVDEIVRNLLAFARPGAGNRSPTTPRELLREAMLSLAWSEDRVRLAGAALTAPLRTDVVAARQILSNLLRNALEAGGESPPIAAEVECAGGRILIDVVDAGPGIPPDLAPRIFDPFVTTKARGTGLGLALCQRVAGYLDGAVTLVATGPGGSRFRLDLPAGEAGPDGG